MPRYSEWDEYEPRAIRKSLPLEWAIGHLFNAWGAGAAMMPCPLPDHQDDTPSFNLWAEDEDGFPIRYGCFGCGANGDVVDAIRLARGVGFLEACRVAVEELIPEMKESDWLPSERIAVERSRPATHDELAAVLDRVLDQKTDDLKAFLERKRMLAFDAAGETLSYAIEEWSWGTFRTPAPTVFFPHRDPICRLTAIRYRSARRDSVRWTERGSRFPALYGAWRDQGHASVLLCEGETDTVWAAWQLRDRPFDVFGLPSGAAAKPMGVEQLQQRTVFLAFDGDLAGQIATARWSEALADVAYKVFVVPVPTGEDVLSCGIPVADLIERAKRDDAA